MGIFNHFTQFALIHWWLGLGVSLHDFSKSVEKMVEKHLLFGIGH